MKKRSEWFFLLVFLGILYAVPALLFLRGDQKTLDYYENRWLASKPEFSKETFLSGEYFDQWEDWLSDHMTGRGRLLQFNTRVQKDLLRRPVVNEVAVGKDAIMLQAPGFSGWNPLLWYDTAAYMGGNLDALRSLIEEQGGEFYYVGIPSRSEYLQEKVPEYVRPDQENLFCLRDAFVSALAERGISFVDVKAAYEKDGNPESYFFQGDHHFTFPGAFSAYKATIQAVNEGRENKLPELEWDDLEIKTLPNPFLGSYDRKLYGLRGGTESFSYGELKTPVPYTRTDNGVQTGLPMVVLPGNDWTEVNYTLFMGGDQLETVINTGRPELPNCLIFGDSFTNALEGLLYPSFHETRSLDLRYYEEKTLREYIEEYRPDVVICIRDEEHWLTTDGNGNVWPEEPAGEEENAS